MSLSPFAATDNLCNYYVFFVFINPINVVNLKSITGDILKINGHIINIQIVYT